MTLKDFLSIVKVPGTENTISFYYAHNQSQTAVGLLFHLSILITLDYIALTLD